MTLDQWLLQVDSNADSDWKAAADKAVRHCAVTMSSFTTDDVWTVLESQGVSTHENRAMGAVMKRLSNAGVIHNTGTTRLSSRSTQHYRPLTVWSASSAQSGVNEVLDRIMNQVRDVMQYRYGAGFLPDEIDLTTLEEIVRAHRV
jgi:hypothetical protein